MTLRVERFEGAPDEWDAFVRGCAGWTHFHLYGWRSVIERALAHECIYLVARGAGGAIDGVLPLVRVRSLLFGHFLVSQPFVNYGGPLGSDAAIVALSQAAVDLADRGGVKLLELRSRRALPVSLPVSHRKITVVLDLPRGNASDLWKRFDSKVRSQIRRPQKEGVTVRFGAAEVDGFFSVFARHMRDLGTPTQSRLLFETIAETFGDDVWFGCAYLDGRPVAGGCAFRWGNEIEMTWASSLSAHKRLAPNMLLYWSFMERAIESGLETFNFGRCSPDSGTHRFKRQWGSRDEPLWWYTHSARGLAATPTPDRGAYAWGARMWRHLPIPVATAVGPHIVRCIP
jgi:FemAB-related protein (PEP-CTERM system-associated)